MGTQISFAAVGGYIVFALRSEAPFDVVESHAFVLLVGLCAIFVVYEVLTWRTFVRAGPTELAQWIRVTEPRGRGRLPARRAGVPGDEKSDWVDYVYLSVQVSTTFSTSDVTVCTTRQRRHVTMHSLIAFVFNTVIVALLVSTLLART